METTKPESWNTPPTVRQENKKVVAGILAIFTEGMIFAEFCIISGVFISE